MVAAEQKVREAAMTEVEEAELYQQEAELALEEAELANAGTLRAWAHLSP